MIIVEPERPGRELDGFTKNIICIVPSRIDCPDINLMVSSRRGKEVQLIEDSFL